ncbi:MAG: zinc-dependent metalloprotease [Oligoflexia bacterium]|nr:zinc-dependent metalloprotease [Oligoflexia bacterium]MBF0364196.1 zinc-dependent metalloprotease [Oligoflexia bacterium]
MKPIPWMLFFSILMMLLAASCAKDRPSEFPQGVNSDDFLSIADFDKQTFNVETKARVKESKLSKAETLVIEDPSIINNLHEVEYQSDSSLLKNVHLMAKENAHYTIQYRLTNKYLKIYKIASKEELPSSEIALSSTNSDGTLSVPLMGYEVSYYKIEKQKDGNGAETHVLMPVSAESKNKASHFKFDISAPIDFKFLNKSDVYPQNFFDGEWFYTATLVSAPTSQNEIIGYELGYDNKFDTASRIKFVKYHNNIKALNLNADSKIDRHNANDELDTVLTIPATWLNYAVKKSAFEEELEEESIGDDSLRSVPWNQRDFMKLDFAASDAKILSKGTYKLDKVLIANNFFSFTLYDDTSKVKVSFAFKKAHAASAKAKTYFEKDQKLFGYFYTQKKMIENIHNGRKEYAEENTFINRFIPSDGVIKYHFSKQTPDFIRPAVRSALQAWNETFKAAGTGISIVLDESKDVDLGDLRYNIINIIDSVGVDTLFGYGPSIADSESGEIVSATANVYISSIRYYIVGFLRNYVVYKLGLAKGLTSFNLLHAKPNTAALISTFDHDNKYTKELMLAVQADKNVSQKLKTLLKESSEYAQAKPRLRSTGHCNFQASNADIIATLEEAIKGDTPCKALPAYIDSILLANKDRLSSDPRTYIYEQELDVLTACANYLLPSQTLETLIHEIGHNFGLRHNFKGSYDKENFQGPLARSSTVMEYLSDGVRSLQKPGPYDVAAIRFAYAGTVELGNKESSLLYLNPKQSIEENLNAYNKSLGEKSKSKIALHPYYYCTDEHVSAGLDPMCARFDTGTTPKEVVQSIIDLYMGLHQMYSDKFDRKKHSDLFMSKFNRVFIPLKVIYNQWRYLLASYLPHENRYLHKFTKVDDYKKMLATARAQNPSNAWSDKITAYNDASELIFDFFLKLAITPNRYCILEENGLSKPVEFKLIREQIFKEHFITINSCLDPQAIALLDKKQISVKDEIGNYFDDHKELLDVEEHERPFKYVGNGNDRELALLMLSLRAPLTAYGSDHRFYPNFYDEPTFKTAAIESLYNRLLNGATIPEFTAATSDPYNQYNVTFRWLNFSTESTKQIYFPKFSHERDLLESIMLNIFQGLLIPGLSEVSSQRMAPFKPIAIDPSNADKVPSHFESISLNSRMLVASNSANPFVYHLLQAYNANQYYNILKTSTLPRIPGEALFEGVIPLQTVASAEEFKKLTLKAFMAMMENNLKHFEKESLYTVILGKLFLADNLSTEIALYEEYKGEGETLLKEKGEQLLVEYAKDQFTTEAIAQSALLSENMKPLHIQSTNAYKMRMLNYLRNKDEFDARDEVIFQYLSNF